MLIVLDVVVRDWDLPVIMTNPLSIFKHQQPRLFDLTNKMLTITKDSF